MNHLLFLSPFLSLCINLAFVCWKKRSQHSINISIFLPLFYVPHPCFFFSHSLSTDRILPVNRPPLALAFDRLYRTAIQFIQRLRLLASICYLGFFMLYRNPSSFLFIPTLQNHRALNFGLRIYSEDRAWFVCYCFILCSTPQTDSYVSRAGAKLCVCVQSLSVLFSVRVNRHVCASLRILFVS